jgi:ring-1,2-phenylacetyl-CoA epoxidase subunit PaaC
MMASLPPIDVPEDTTGAGAFDSPAAGEPDPARFDYLLRLGDDALILGQRLSNGAAMPRRSKSTSASPICRSTWSARPPLLLNEAGTCEGEGRDGDRLAFHRDVLEFRNCLLVEQPNGDFARR